MYHLYIQGISSFIRLFLIPDTPSIAPDCIPTLLDATEQLGEAHVLRYWPISGTELHALRLGQPQQEWQAIT